MAASSGIIGKGTTLSYCATVGGSYTALSEIVECPFPEQSMGKADLTHYGSDDSTMEYIPGGWTEPGDMSVTANYVKTATTTLIGTLYGVNYFYKITLPDGSTWIGRGFISKIGGTIPNKDAIRTQFTITQTAKWTFAAAA